MPRYFVHIFSLLKNESSSEVLIYLVLKHCKGKIITVQGLDLWGNIDKTLI